LTAFVIWLKTFTARPGLLVIALLAMALMAGGCGLLGRSPKAQTPQQPLQPPPEVEAPPAPLAGLTPLPSANELLSSVVIGREDPLAPQAPVARSASTSGQSQAPAGASQQAAAAAAPAGAPSANSQLPAAAPARLELPDDFLFSGVLRVGSTPQAFVQVGDQSGPVCPGPDGSCPATGLPSVLPQGWGVAAIDVDRGSLTLRKGSRTVTTKLF
jgi:hypothetical protein